MGSRCRVVFPDNRVDRAIATDFDLFDEIDVKVADMFEVKIDDQEIALAVTGPGGSPATDRIAIDSSGNVEIGPKATLEKTFLAETTKDWLNDLLSIFVENPLTVDVITGPEAASPVLIAKIEAHRAKLPTLLSEKVKVG